MLGYAASSPFRTRRAYRWTVETGIYLAPEAYGRGIGRALLSTLLQLLERQGYVAAIGAVALPNDASVALHEKLGFTYAGAYRGSRLQVRRMDGRRPVAEGAGAADQRARGAAPVRATASGR